MTIDKLKPYKPCNCPFTKRCAIEVMCKPINYKTLAPFAYQLACALTKLRELSDYEITLQRCEHTELATRIYEDDVSVFSAALMDLFRHSLQCDSKYYAAPFMRWVYNRLLNTLETVCPDLVNIKAQVTNAINDLTAKPCDL